MPTSKKTLCPQVVWHLGTPAPPTGAELLVVRHARCSFNKHPHQKVFQVILHPRCILLKSLLQLDWGVGGAVVVETHGSRAGEFRVNSPAS